MSFNQPIKPSFSFKGFRRRGEENPDGWGLAWYRSYLENSVQIIKEPIKAGKSELSELLLKKVHSKIIMAHVRLASKGKVKYSNTHPFYRELSGKEYCFAHNGTLNNYRGLDKGRFTPIGETDSEYAFCHILNSIENRDINQWRTENFRWLWDKLRKINEYGSFNCLFSDREYLFCYYDKKGYNGLCFLHRKAPYGRFQLLDLDYEINLADEKNPNQIGFIIATTRLTNEEWINFNFGELIVFKEGRLVFSSVNRNVDSLLNKPSDLEINILSIIMQKPHRVSLEDIFKDLNFSKEEIKSAMRSLICRGLIKQDSRDKVKWDSNKATFYTERTKRMEIDGLIE